MLGWVLGPMGFSCTAWYECHWGGGWYIGLVANGIIALAYLAIAYHIFTGLRRTGQWEDNLLGRATGAIFLTCGVGHGIVAAHLLLPTFGIEQLAGNAARVQWSEWHLWLWTPVTAAVGVTYWLIRNRLPGLVEKAALYDDIEARRQRAMQVHDTVVQDLATTKRLLEEGQIEAATEKVDETMETAQAIVAEYIGEDGAVDLQAGALQRPEDLGEGLPP